MLGGIFFCALLYGYYSMVYSEQTDQMAMLETRLRRIERHVQHAKKTVEKHNIDDLKRELNLLENQLGVLERLLPKAEEVPDLLEMVERKGIRTGINSVLFEPAGVREDQLYKEIIYNVSIRGGYHKIGNFLAKIGSSSRIVKTSSLQLSSEEKKDQREGSAVVARFELSTYILPEGKRSKIEREKSEEDNS
jgi:type IV pilus assembly protein PilO